MFQGLAETGERWYGNLCCIRVDNMYLHLRLRELGSMGGRKVCTDACRPSPFCIETVQYSRQKFWLGLLLLFVVDVLFKIIVFIS